MARAPIAGRCKTRLAASIGAERAASLYRAMLLDTLAHIERSFDARLVVMAAPEDDGVDELSRIVPPRWEVLAQRGDGLGARLGNALVTLSSTSGAPVALVDSDSPTAPWAASGRAFAAMPAERSVLLGPCDDGGYWLVAAAAGEVRIFEGIAWSTPAVAAQTRERCAELGLECEDLPCAYDVDDARDLARLGEELAQHPELAPLTAAELGHR